MTGVHLKVGYLRQVVPAALTFSFELVAEGTPLEGATLRIEPVPAVGRCRHCGVESLLREFPLACERCGGFDLTITAGEELLVEALDLEEDDNGSGNDEDAGGRGSAGRQ